MLWCSKYRPLKLYNIAGNAESVSRLKKWALSFSLGKIQKPLLMYGPVGCGKSAATFALANELELEPIYIFPPDKNETDKWEKRLGEILAGSSLFGNSSVVICEDIDKWHLSKIRGLIPKLASKLTEAKVPVILSAQDAYDRRLSSLRSYCTLLEFKSINNSDLLGAIAKICDSERMSIQKEQLQQIALHSQGDLRAAINDLQALNFDASRESQKKQFEILKMVFRSPSYAASRNVDLGPLMERSSLKLYTSENMPSEFFDAQDMADGFNFLSRADVFDGRIMRRQYWGYLRYSSTLMLWGISSCRRHIRAGYVPYAFPSYIRKMGATRSKRAVYKHAGAKIAPKCHCTTKHTFSYIPLICLQLQTLEPKEITGKKLCAYYKFDEEELASVCGISQKSLYSQKKKKTN